jgi:mycofactocin precursor
VDEGCWWTTDVRHGQNEVMAVTQGEALSAIDDEPVVEDEELVEDELLVEEVSIDGMCGVY